MYNPEDVLTKDGYLDYIIHLRNIKHGLFFIENHANDLHIGCTNGKQYDDFQDLLGSWHRLSEVLRTGDGEIYKK